MKAIIQYLRKPCFILHPVSISILLSVAISLGSVQPTRADWRTDIGTFRVGVVAKGNLDETYAKIEPFRLAIAEALGLNVEVFIAKNYRTLINAHIAARIEYAVYSATAYASVWKNCECVEPIVIPKSYNGAESYKSVIITSENGPKNLTGLAASKMTGLSKSSFAGHKFAVFELESSGIQLPDNIEFSDSGEEAISAFVSGKYNAIIGWSSLSGDPGEGYSSGTLRLIAEQNGGTSIPYKIIWQSSAIPHRPHVVRKNLAGEAKILLRDTLSAMFDSDPVAYDSIEPVFGGGFVVARHGQFLPILKYVEALVPDKDKSTASTKQKTDQ